jgi:glucose/arabinose dehydrogenase
MIAKLLRKEVLWSLTAIVVLLLVGACAHRSTVKAAADSTTLGTYFITPQSLPKPYETDSVNNGPSVVPRPDGAELHVPKGFAIHEWAADLNNPRAMAVAPNGDIFVAESGPNRVTVLRDSPDHSKPAQRSVFASHLRQPFGIAFYPPGKNPAYVYIANTDSVIRYPYKNGDLQPSGTAETIIDNLPLGGYHQHWTRRILFSPDGKKLYVSVGSKSNVGEEEEKRAVILQYNPDGTGFRVFASGIRNPVGLAFNPVSGQLWAAVNERDGLGDGVPPDYVTSIKDGGFYGWPWYYIGVNHDPRMRERPELASKVIVPDVLLDAHSAALSVAFYTAKEFPKAYLNSAFTGLHGSWNRSDRSGYKVVHIPFDSHGRARGGFEDFVTGWVTPDGDVWGRPVDVVVANDGALLISDDGGNKIWRVSYDGAKGG